ncbi:hypothetical protein LTS18_014922 [Coniosporium uncinatum]|uniref:Uncharacterized protein n=1 Tax=Coniosporium uncinatum TaxID=93489 RepID=A0ACC3D8I9_9PEZI|nr:hypothetical protein LTS18_014922 [Coniosporium uncinatum]
MSVRLAKQKLAERLSFMDQVKMTLRTYVGNKLWSITESTKPVEVFNQLWGRRGVCLYNEYHKGYSKGYMGRLSKANNESIMIFVQGTYPGQKGAAKGP